MRTVGKSWWGRSILFLLIVVLLTPSLVLFPEGAEAAGPDTPETICDQGMSACLSYILFYLPFVALTAPITFLTGQVLNFSIAFSLSRPIVGNPFVETGWKVVRDVMNLAFIFILVYIAIATILSLENFHTWRLLASVVVVALLVNFSLFTARIVIDASNFLAVEFYNKMAVAPAIGGSDLIKLTQQAGTSVGIIAPKDLSGAVMQALGTHKLLDVRYFKLIIGDGKEKSAGRFIKNFALLAVLFILFGIANLITAGVFIAGALIFVGRIIALWLLMIAAAAGFVAFILPQTKRYATMWWSNLLCYSFVAPVYLFLIYLFLLFLYGSAGTGSGSLANKGSLIENLLLSLNPSGKVNTDGIFGAKSLAATSDSSMQFWITLGFFILNFVIVFVFLFQITKISKTLGCGIGEKAVDWLSNPATYRGYGGFVGRNTLGRAAYSLRESNLMRRWAASTPTLARPFVGLLNLGAKGKYGGSAGRADIVAKQKSAAQQYADYASKTWDSKKERYVESGKARTRVQEVLGGKRGIPNLFPPILASRGGLEAYRAGRSASTAVGGDVKDLITEMKSLGKSITDLDSVLEGRPKDGGGEGAHKDRMGKINAELAARRDRGALLTSVVQEALDRARNTGDYRGHRNALKAEARNRQMIELLKKLNETEKKSYAEQKKARGEVSTKEEKH